MDEPPQPTKPNRLASYLSEDLRGDAVAGLTVAVLGVPQGMAYALIAGLPPVFGLYTAIVTCIVAAVIGSSRHLVTGPTNALCMVILSLTAHIPDKYEGVSFIEAALLLTFMTGVIQMLFGALNLGRVIRYVSSSVVIGFTAGAGILIALNQVKNILGFDIKDVNAHAERSYEVLWATMQKLGDTSMYALGIGLATALIVVYAPKIDRRVPGALIGIAVTGAASYFFGWHEQDVGVEIVRDIGEIQGNLALWHLPSLIESPNYELTRELGTGALALAILGLIEAASIARAVATSSGQRLNFTREFVGQGASNIVGSFFSCFAGSGSFTRTAVCYKSGGRTRMAAVFSAGWTTLALVLLGPVANFIPKAALAGILIVVAYSMIDKRRLALTWRSGKNPRMVLIGTLGSTLILPLEFAIFIGVFLSIVILLRTTARTDLTQLVHLEDSGFEEVPFNMGEDSPVVTVNMEGALYFAAAEDLDYELLRCITRKTRVVVLRMKRLRSVGATAMAMLEHFWALLRARGVYLVVCGIEDELQTVMTGSGLRKRIGEQNIFYADNKLFQSTELALARAWSIVEMEKLSADTVPFEGEAQKRLSATAVDVMSPRTIRFGNQHQLREAVWLMSELNKHTKSTSPEPLFLQNREGKLDGELSPWRILEALRAGASSQDHVDSDDREIAELLRKDFLKPINLIVRRDIPACHPESPLGHLADTFRETDLQVLPICDNDGRVKGRVSNDALLQGVMKELARREKSQ